MFTNIDTKSLKGFLYCKFIDIYPFVCGIMTLIAVGLTVCGITASLNDQEKKPVSLEQTTASMLSNFEIDEHFYFRVALTSLSAKLNAKEEPREQLTGKALYLQYISEIVSNHYPDLDRKMVAAVIYHESRFQPDVTNSKTGATGLMQILPKWHTERARNLGVTDLSDPYGNILVGCDILNEVYQQSNSMDYALDVYAGGYRYANTYKKSVSPYRLELEQILNSNVLGKE